MTNSFRPPLRWASLAVLMFVMSTQFVNCGQYSSPSNDSSSNSTLNCDANSCVIPDPDNLKITVNLNGGSEYGLSADILDFNLGGDCNEAGYPFNMIYWELQLNQQTVRTSNMVGMNTGNPSATVNTICQNGRYQLYVNMAPIAADPVNRQGCLTNTGQTAPYDLYVTILGKPSSTGVGFQNTLTGRTHISLTPQ